MKTIERLEQFINFRGLSLYAFDSSIGVGNGYMGKQIKKKGSIGSDILELIFSQYPELNPTWLLTGNGSMLLEKTGFPVPGKPLGSSKKRLKQEAAFTKMLDRLPVEYIVAYIHENERSRGFHTNALYNTFITVRAQRQVLEAMETLKAQYQELLSEVKKKKH